jgi:hypothetical protein
MVASAARGLGGGSDLGEDLLRRLRDLRVRGVVTTKFWGEGWGEQMDLSRSIAAYGRLRFYFPAKFALL